MAAIARRAPGVRPALPPDLQKRLQLLAGAWTVGPGDMADGLPIFSDLAYGECRYDPLVHKGFTAWLEARGWYLECHHCGACMAVAIRATQLYLGMTQEECDAVAAASVQALPDQYNRKPTSVNGFAGDLGRLHPRRIPVPDSELPF